jgi:ABC-type antimicrobial peptide transport system permease subunit
VILAALGTYSVTAYAVARRTREYGIRLALGERPASIRRRAIWGALVPAITGLCAGCAASLASARFLDTFLYGVSARDPRAVAIGCAALLGMAAVAAASAAGKAARLDPLAALRAR